MSSDLNFVPKALYQGFTVRRAVSLPSAALASSPAVPLIKRRKTEMMPQPSLMLGRGMIGSPFAHTITPTGQAVFFPAPIDDTVVDSQDMEEYYHKSEVKSIAENAPSATPNTLNIAHTLTAMALPPLAARAMRASPMDISTLQQLSAAAAKDGISLSMKPQLYRSRDIVHASPDVEALKQMTTIPATEASHSSETSTETCSDENTPQIASFTPIKSTATEDIKPMVMPLAPTNICA